MRIDSIDACSTKEYILDSQGDIVGVRVSHYPTKIEVALISPGRGIRSLKDQAILMLSECVYRQTGERKGN